MILQVPLAHQWDRGRPPPCIDSYPQQLLTIYLAIQSKLGVIEVVLAVSGQVRPSGTFCFQINRYSGHMALFSLS